MQRTAANHGQGSLFDLLEDEPEAPVTTTFTVVPPAPAPPAIVTIVRPTGPTVPTGTGPRIRANLDAIRTLSDVKAWGEATPAQRDKLAAWSGWGAVPELFDERYDSLAWARDELAELLTPEQIAAASRSTLNAHYTDPRMVAAMWQTVAALGFTGGRVLEPGCGSGNFLAAAPTGTRLTGVELDPVTATIAQARCPDATIVSGSFADTKLTDGHFDLVIGNVPFGRISLHDSRHNKGKHSIHNHFIIKSLHLTRPGGLVAVITSRYTLDAEDTSARREIQTLADLVTAVRFPTDAHRETAGTRVVTDLLIFRRRDPGQVPEPAQWIDTVTVDIDDNAVPINRVFEDGRGGIVLGKLRAVHGAYRAGDMTVEAGSTTWLDALPEILRAAIASTRLRWTPPAEPEPVDQPEPVRAGDVQEGFITRLPDGSYAKAVNGEFVAHAAPKSQTRELSALLGLRDAALAVLAEETSTVEASPRLESLRTRLRNAYTRYVAAHGHLNRVTERRTGRTNAETGDEIMARVRPPMGGFRDDPYAPLVFALEDYDPESQTATMAPILTRRVIVPRQPATTADNPADALAICLDTTGRVDLDVIARLLDTTPDHARKALDGLIFDDPAAGLVTAAEYLSGDVRAKLTAAERAADDDPAYAPNVAALRDVIPADLTPGEIDGRLGAVWIDAEIVQTFLRELLDSTWLTVEHPGGQIWSVDGPSYGVKPTVTWGTRRMAAPAIAQAVLEQRKIEVRDRTWDDKYILNPDETAAAMEKATEMQDRFAEWLWEDPERAATLTREYNAKFNSIVLRSYDGARLTLPGLSESLTPRDHQHSAVARIRSEPATGLFHDVGAGKTLEMSAGAMELRRLGLANKPCVVVPNHMLDQFAGEWLRAYPLAKILICRQEDLSSSDNRRKFVARVATGDWDAVIMSSSAFERIPMTPQAQADYLARETEMLRAWLSTAKESRGRTTKRIEAALAKAEERVKAKLDSAKDRGIYFEDTGIDYLFIDEAHRYKNLRTGSAIQGAAIDGSQRASDLDMKIAWLRDRNGSRVVTFATATPIANSITEIYVMTKYLRPDLLADAGIEVFDTWAATFGQLVTEVELAPEGGGSFRLNTRFAKFRNVPELLRMFHVFADVKTADDLDLEVPLLAERDEDGKRTPATIVVQPSDDLREYVLDLGERATKIRTRQVKPEEDNMLKVSGDGRSAALDLRLVGLAQTEPGKIAAAAREIYARWVANRDRAYLDTAGDQSHVRGSLQLVFCDLGTPREQWNAYRELRDRLTDLGMPGGMIRFIHDAKKDRDKATLFAACRAGNVAVLVGSTEKMGVGTNVQDRAIALHHLDAPWRPADIAQRDGRIMRQGNQNPEVEILRYAVEGSFDGYMWQTLTRKARFIYSVLRGRLDVREVDDIGDTALSYAEVKALATGNPLLMDQAKANAALAVLQRQERAHHRNQSHLTTAIRDNTHRAESLRTEAAECEVALAQRVDTRGDEFTMTIGVDEYDRRGDAGTPLAEIIRDMIRVARETESHQRGTVGTLAGFPVKVEVLNLVSVLVYLSLVGAPGTEISTGAIEARDGVGLIKRLEHRAARLDEYRVKCLDDADRADRQVADAQAILGQPFPKAAELEAAIAEVERVEAALEALARPAQPKPEPAAA